MPPKKNTAAKAKAPTLRNLKPKGKEAARPKGIQKPPRKEKRKKLTPEELKAQVDAMAPMEWPFPKYTYIELQPPDEEEAEENNGYVNRHLKKLKKNYNGSEVKISEGAYDRLTKMYIEVEKRTPESNGIVHIFEDYRGLGIMEVIGGQILDYTKELKRAHPDEFSLFQIVEALSFFLDGAYDDAWFNVDDGEGVEALVDLIGVMFVDCFHRLNVDNHPLACLISPPELSPMKNLGLVMGLAIGFGDAADSITCGDESLYWQEELRKIAKARGVVLRNTKGLVKLDEEEGGAAQDAGEGGNDSGGSKDPDEEQEDKFDFTAKVATYKKKHGKLGGNHYDLSLEAPLERRGRGRRRR